MKWIWTLKQSAHWLVRHQSAGCQYVNANRADESPVAGHDPAGLGQGGQYHRKIGQGTGFRAWPVNGLCGRNLKAGGKFRRYNQQFATCNASHRSRLVRFYARNMQGLLWGRISCWMAAT